jgi:hypothetical protein
MLYLFRKEREGKAALLSLPQAGKEAQHFIIGSVCR